MIVKGEQGFWSEHCLPERGLGRQEEGQGGARTRKAWEFHRGGIENSLQKPQELLQSYPRASRASLCWGLDLCVALKGRTGVHR